MRISSWFQLSLVACGLTLMTNACSDASTDDDTDVDGGTSSSSGEAASSGALSSSSSSSSSGSSGTSTSSSSSSSSGANDDDGGSDASDASDASDEPDARDAGDDASDASDASIEPPAPPAVQFLGRWDLSTPGEAAASWPATRLVVRMNGTGLNVTVTQGATTSGGLSRYDVLVDGVVQAAPLVLDVGNKAYSVVAGLAAGVHTIELVRRTEPQQGITRFTAIAPVGELLAPPPRPTRRIEVLSESSVNGYGIESPNPYGSPCNDAPGPSRFHNARKSFGQKLADALHAELFLTATSLFGVVRNEDGSNAPLFKDVFEQVHPFSALPKWTFPTNQPDVVFVMLGGADYGATRSAPAGLAAGYRAFATQLRGVYPDAELIYAVGPQIKNSYPPGQNMRTNVKSIMEDIVATDGADKNQVQVFPEINDPTFEQGCYGHATEALHTNMATIALPWVRAATGWVD